MSEREALEQAIRDGVVSPDQADRLKDYLARGGDTYAPGDPENLRFLSSFNDIFLTIGIFILMGGLVVAAGVIVSPFAGIGMTGPVVGAIVATVAWMLAEYFCGRRRLRLPSMALALIVYLAVGSAVGALIARFSADSARAEIMAAADNGLIDFSLGDFLLGRVFGANYWSMAAGAAAMAAFYARFRLPFTFFLIAMTAASAFYVMIAQHNGLSALGGGVLLIAGLATLCAAIAYDMADPERRTVKTDNAFWLHLAAAPQIMMGLRYIILGGASQADTGAAAVMLAVLLAMTVLSLALNRRALVFSGLLTYVSVVFTLVNASGVTGAYRIIWPLVLVGASVVLLGAGWRIARHVVLGALPRSGIWMRLFPPEYKASEHSIKDKNIVT